MCPASATLSRPPPRKKEPLDLPLFVLPLLARLGTLATRMFIRALRFIGSIFFRQVHGRDDPRRHAQVAEGRTEGARRLAAAVP